MLFSPSRFAGDTIVGGVEILEVRTDKPITKSTVRVTRDGGVEALRSDAVCLISAPAAVVE